MKCLYIGIVLLMYNYMMIFGQVLSDAEETSYIDINNETRIMERECIPASSMNSYVKHRCPKNMAFYRVENEINVWMCECKQGFIYFPLDDSCYEAYKQGPCPSKNYLVLPVNETLSRCVENPCLEDGIVPYNGACSPLQTIGFPCKPKYRLQVDIITFQLMCMPMYDDSWGGFNFDFATRNCPSGSRRSLKSEACIKVQARHN
ncbi:DUF4789 domain-containing protein [Camponotus japonicus]